MMDPVVAALHEHYTDRNAEFARQLEGITNEGLNYHAGKNQNSIFENLIHALGVQRGNVALITGATIEPQRPPNVVGTLEMAQERLQQAAADLDTYLNEGASVDVTREVTMYR